MKRLMTLLALAAMTASASGCFHWFNRGSSCSQCGSPAAYAPPPAAPACNTPYMMPQGGAPTYEGGTYLPAPGV